MPISRALFEATDPEKELKNLLLVRLDECPDKAFTTLEIAHNLDLPVNRIELALQELAGHKKIVGKSVMSGIYWMAFR